MELCLFTDGEPVELNLFLVPLADLVAPVRLRIGPVRGKISCHSVDFLTQAIYFSFNTINSFTQAIYFSFNTHQFFWSD
jgi:hypothetical protein